MFLTDSQTFEIFVKHCFVFDPVKEVALSVLAIIVFNIVCVIFCQTPSKLIPNMSATLTAKTSKSSKIAISPSKHKSTEAAAKVDVKSPDAGKS